MFNDNFDEEDDFNEDDWEDTQLDSEVYEVDPDDE